MADPEKLPLVEASVGAKPATLSWGAAPASPECKITIQPVNTSPVSSYSKRGFARRDSRTVLQSQIGSTGLTSNSLVRSRSSRGEKKGFGGSSSENNLTSSAGRLEPDSHPVVTVGTSADPEIDTGLRTSSTWSVRLFSSVQGATHTLQGAHTQNMYRDCMQPHKQTIW